MDHQRLAALALTAILCAGTSALAAPDIRQAQDKPVIMFPDGEVGRPVVLKTLRTRVESPPAVVGPLQFSMFCRHEKDITWDEKTQAFFTQGLRQTFAAELGKARYPLLQVVESMFEDGRDKSKTGAGELQVGAFIREVNMRLCHMGFGGEYWVGEGIVTVFWQVFAPEQQKVVFETVTEGSFRVDKSEVTTANRFFQQAFAMATRNLLADGRYLAAVRAPVVGVVADAAASSFKDRLSLKAGAPSTEPLTKRITMLRTAVATIRTESATGSGFFISADGHLLTNHHVVGKARFVKVVLPTGRELVGEVVRLDEARDIALVKTEPIAVQPLALRDSETNIGEEVYAMGSPRGEQFNTTLTRGIISGHRLMDNGNRYLQSDVAIHPGSSGGPLMDGQGSVVGVSVMGRPDSPGMNFFIPIGDALTRLNIDAGR